MSATGRASHEMGACTSKVYSDRLFFKALVIMIVRHLHTVHELLSQVMKKYSPQKIIGKSNTNFFPDNKILLAIAAATILTFADTTDVIAGDDYPIGYGGTVDDVGTMASQVQSAATQYGIGSGMALQAVSWQEYYPPKHCNPYPSCAPFPT